MPNLMQIESELRETEAEILNCYDIDTGEEMQDPSVLEERMVILHQQAVTKRDHYARLLMDKFFQRMEEKINDKIKRLEREKKDLRFRKEQIELALHNHVVSNNTKSLPVLGEDNKPELYITPALSVTKSVPNIEEVEPKYVHAEIKGLSLEEYYYFRDMLMLSSNHKMKEILSKLEQGLQKKVNVSDLPEDHRAIRKTIRPTIKTTIRRPKDET